MLEEVVGSVGNKIAIKSWCYRLDSEKTYQDHQALKYLLKALNGPS